MSEEGTSAGGGIGFLGLLTILFIGLKFGGVIDWSWVWVLGAFWIPLVIALLLYVGFIVIPVTFERFYEKRKEKDEEPD